MSLLLEREEGRERNIDWLPPVRAHTRDCTHNPDMCSDQELNPQPFGFGTTLQPTEPHWPGQKYAIPMCRMMICLAVSFLPVKKSEKSAIACGLASNSKEIHPLTNMFDLFYFVCKFNFSWGGGNRRFRSLLNL